MSQQMFTPVPRVQVAATVMKDAVFTVKTLISHAMETGLRHDKLGALVPRRIINKFICRHNGVIVFDVDFHEAVAANPFLEFDLRATESGPMEFEWHEDGGAVFRLQHLLTVV